MRPTLSVLVVCSSITGAIIPPAAAQPDADVVQVVNFPAVQTVSGTVQIGEPAPHARLLAVSEAIVPTVAPSDTAALTSGGILDVAGFVSAVVSLAGQVKSDYFREGTVGALLVPDTELVATAFEEEGQILFPLRVEVGVTPGSGAYFGSSQPQVRLAFPRYRVYFFNTTDRPASVTLYAYLTN